LLLRLDQLHFLERQFFSLLDLLPSPGFNFLL